MKGTMHLQISNFEIHVAGPNPEFTKRGSVTVRSLKGGRAQFSKPVSLSSEERSKLRVCCYYMCSFLCSYNTFEWVSKF